MHEPIWHWPARARGTLQRWLAPLWFRSVGPGARIHRGLRHARPFMHVTLGARAVLKHAVFLQAGRQARIEIGDDCLINTGGHIVAAKGIEIGAGTRIAEYVSIRDQEHSPELGRSVADTPVRTAAVVIGRNVWIGRGCYIGPGVRIGDGAVIGANSVVRSDIPAGSMAAGAPARVRKILASGSDQPRRVKAA